MIVLFNGSKIANVVNKHTILIIWSHKFNIVNWQKRINAVTLSKFLDDILDTRLS